MNYMKRALDLAKAGEGFTSPNPLVGAVIVKEGRIVGEGYHKAYGENHAEVEAFLNAKEEVEGGTMYVSLEPCSHHGQTPPCANLIVEKGIKKVVIGMKDPNPLVSGRGIEILEKAGIEVVTGLMEEEAKKQNEVFIKYITSGLPFVLMKTAMTLDGKIATSTGNSKWITGGSSRDYVHKIRGKMSAIMVGIGTILADNPSLTTRIEGQIAKDPIRIIVDSSGRIPMDARVLKLESKSKTIVVLTEKAEEQKIRRLEEAGVQVIRSPLKEGRVDLTFLMRELGKRKIDSILLEGGSELNYIALREGIVDKVQSFIAPKIIGGATAKTPVDGEGIQQLSEAICLKDMEVHRFGQDFMLEGYIKKED